VVRVEGVGTSKLEAKNW